MIKGIIDEVIDALIEERKNDPANFDCEVEWGNERAIKSLNEARELFKKSVNEKFKNPHKKAEYGRGLCNCDWCFSATKARNILLTNKDFKV